MAKRFTDSEKWKDPWFCGLSDKDKMFWIYILDNCNHAGIWQENFPLVNFYIKDYKLKKEVFNGRIVEIKNDKWFIPKFIQFQYGELVESNRAHSSVITILKKEGVYKLLTSPIQGAKDKDKDKDMDKVKDKEQQPINDNQYTYVQLEKDFVGAWNGLCDTYPALSKIKGVSDSRKVKLNKRYTEKEFVENVLNLFNAIKEQPFLLNGNENSKEHSGWRISFDWLIANDINYMKVLEYRYKQQVNEKNEMEEIRRKFGLTK